MPDPIINAFPTAASIAAQGTTTKRLDATLAKLAAATAVKPVPVDAVSAVDDASLSRANVVKAVRQTAPLRELGSRLIDLRRVLAGVKGPAGTNDAQSKIDASLVSVRKAAESFRAFRNDEPLSVGAPGQNYTLSGVAEGISNIRVNPSDLGPASSIAVNVEVTASAQHAGLGLSFGGLALDLADSDAQFAIRIGNHTFSFASGTSLAAFADTINATSNAEGLSAVVSGTAVRIDTRGFGSQEFLSVEIVDDGGIRGDGIYRFEANDHTTADLQTRVAFVNGAEANDEGQDLEVDINGQRIAGDGLHIQADLGAIKVEFDVDEYIAQWFQSFTAFTVVGTSPPTALDRLSGADTGALSGEHGLELVDDAIREVERAEREELLARGAEDLSIDDEDLPFIREAQAKLVEEARRLGLLADPDPDKAFDALKP